MVKPDPGIFAAALRLDLPAEEVLMVGDAWRDDAAAAALGVRTLILPRTDARSTGWSWCCALGRGLSREVSPG